MSGKGRRRMRIWKKIRFRGGMVLLVMVGIGVLSWHSYRKAMGPPATPRGKSPEFDKHLAEIDEKWLFLFADGGRILRTDIRGQETRPSLDIAELLELDEIHVCYGGFASPDAKWLIMCCYVSRDSSKDTEGEEFVLVDLEKSGARLFTPDRNAYRLLYKQLYWLDQQTFVVLAKNYGETVGRVPSRSSPFQWFRYDIHHLETPEPAGIPQIAYASLFDRHVVFAEASQVLFLMQDESADVSRLLAYDVDGLRIAADEERKRFRQLGGLGDWYKLPAHDDAPSIATSWIAKNSWPMRLIPGYGRNMVRPIELILGGKRARRTDVEPQNRRGWSVPEWDEDLQLFIWMEPSLLSRSGFYYMDKKGHYRFWRHGTYLDKVPR